MKKVRGRPFDFQFGTDMNRREEKGRGMERGSRREFKCVLG